MHCSTTDNRYLVCYKDIYLEANQVTVDLLHCLAKAESVETAVETYVSDKNNKYPKDKIIDYVNQKLIPKFQTTTNISKKKFLWQIEILNSETVGLITKYLGFMFNRPLMCTIVTIAIMTDVLFFYFTPNLFQYSDGSNLYVVLGLLVCMCVSSFFHELGHASACSFYGVKHGGIGLGLYLTFPVLYTDVNNAWRLPRRKRCVVNFAGVYFQSIIMILLAVMFYITDLHFLKYILLMMNVGFVFVLNPFFKFDGYWLASDILGVPNLRKRANELVTYFYVRLMHKQVDKPYMYGLGRITMIVFCIYTLFSTAFMGYFFLYVIPLFIYNFIQTFPADIERMVMYLSAGVAMPFSLLRNIVSQALFMVLIIVMVVYPLYIRLKSILYVRRQ